MQNNMASLYKLGEKIRTIRKLKGRSLTDLAASVGSEKGNLSRIENGLVTPTLETICRIADELDVPINIFLGSDEQDYFDMLRTRTMNLPPDKAEAFKDLIENAFRLIGI